MRKKNQVELSQPIKIKESLIDVNIHDLKSTFILSFLFSNFHQLIRLRNLTFYISYAFCTDDCNKING